MHRTRTKPQKRARREGAAMLIVLMVLLMTTAMATFAIHATSVELRGAGHARQAVQAEHLAEGATYAGVTYIDRLGASGSLMQYLRTNVTANTQTSPYEATMDRNTNLLRVRMEDFSTAAGVHGPPLETDPARHPSYGPYSTLYQPNFTIDGTDLHQISRDVAGTDLSGRGAHFYRVTLTSLAQIAPQGDVTMTGDPRSYNEVASRARAYAEVGPFWLGGH